MKVDRDTNYPKFKAACAAAQVPCPEDNKWLEDLKPEEFDLDDLPIIEQETESMAPTSSKMFPSPVPSSNLRLANSPHQYDSSKLYSQSNYL